MSESPAPSPLCRPAPGLASYFVDRPGGVPSGSNYFSPEGTSFMLDPITGDPASEDWSRFLVGGRQGEAGWTCTLWLGLLQIIDAAAGSKASGLTRRPAPCTPL